MSEVDAVLGQLRERLGREPDAMELIQGLLQRTTNEVLKTAETSPDAAMRVAVRLLQAEQKRPRGRPLLGARPMTSAERNQRAKDRLKARCGDLEQCLSEAVAELEAIREVLGKMGLLGDDDTELVTFLGRCRKLLDG